MRITFGPIQERLKRGPDARNIAGKGVLFSTVGKFDRDVCDGRNINNAIPLSLVPDGTSYWRTLASRPPAARANSMEANVGTGHTAHQGSGSQEEPHIASSS